MRRKIDNQNEARRCLRAAERAGLTAGEWAREHGIDGRSLNAWRMNLARRGPQPGVVARSHSQPPPASFIQVDRIGGGGTER